MARFAEETIEYLCEFLLYVGVDIDVVDTVRHFPRRLLRRAVGAYGVWCAACRQPHNEDGASPPAPPAVTVRSSLYTMTCLLLRRVILCKCVSSSCYFD